MSDKVTIMLVGTGAFAREICLALVALTRESFRIILVGRSDKKVSEIRHLAKSASGEVEVQFETALINFEEQSDFDNIVDLYSPRIVVNCASYHSPREADQRPSAWTNFVSRAGFGITLPLQAVFAVRLARSLARRGHEEALLINACFPDAVNPVLSALGLPTYCGIGNVGTIAAGIAAELTLPKHLPLRLLAHHVHLHGAAPNASEPLVWIGDIAVDNVPVLLLPQRTLSRSDRYRIGGSSAAKVVLAILRGDELKTNVPGPLGLAGGYPVCIHGTRIELDLPTHTSRACAVDWNQQAAAGDGLASLNNNKITFAHATEEVINDVLPSFIDGLGINRIEEASKMLLSLRERMREIPSDYQIQVT